VVDSDAGRAAGLRLLVVEGGAQRVVSLPTRGDMTIGRAAASALRLADPHVSREHALLRVGAAVTITDLGGPGGTTVGSRRLVAGETIALAPGVPITVGTTTLVLKFASASTRLRHVRGHAYFEQRVDDECARAQTLGTTFAVVRVRCGDAGAAVIEDGLAKWLGEMDVVAMFGPNDYELLLVDTSPDDATRVCDDIREELAARELDVQLGLACYPHDARGAGELIRVAERATRTSEPIADPMTAVRALVQRIAPSEISVLLLGETGAGKEVWATNMHRGSPRANQPFLCINCAALTESLLESELFGYERGAFTGAASAKAGLLETANGGTLFLDEIGEMPITIQAKILRVIEQREVVRLGAVRARAIDVRFLSATNRDLQLEVSRGAFRSDLYFRLAAVTVMIPPLRDRNGEIVDLATAFLAQFAEHAGRRPPHLSYEAREALERYDWPGNVRELRNVIERALLLCTGRVITPAHLPAELQRDTPKSEPPSDPYTATPTLPPPAVACSDDERQRIQDALLQCGGNQTRAAKLLNVSRRTLTSWLTKYELPRPRRDAD
jgi:two-component system response regulator AtoC